jgi:hypothetical protein
LHFPLVPAQVLLKLPMLTRSFLLKLALDSTVHRIDFPFSLPLSLAYLLLNGHVLQDANDFGRNFAHDAQSF